MLGSFKFHRHNKNENNKILILLKMSSEVAEQIVVNIILEAIDVRNGKPFTDSTSLLNFMSIICINAATLEYEEYKDLHINDKVNIVTGIIPEVYKHLIDAKLVPSSLEDDISALFNDLNLLKEKVRILILIYNLTTQLIDLPSFNDASKASLSAIVKNSNLPKILYTPVNSKSSSLFPCFSYFSCFSCFKKDKNKNTTFDEKSTFNEKTIEELIRDFDKVKNPVLENPVLETVNENQSIERESISVNMVRVTE